MEQLTARYNPAMRKGSRFLFIVGVAWLAMSLTAVGLFGSALFKQHRTNGWQPVPGTISDSEVASRPGNKGHPIYWARIAYVYRVEGKDYTGDLTSMAPALTSTDRAPAEAQAAALPAGKQVTVYYDPAHPERAVLERGLRARDWTVLVFLTPFVLVGTFLLSLAFGAHRCRGPGFIGTKRVVETPGGLIRVRTQMLMPGNWGFIWALITSFVGVVLLLALLSGRLTEPLLMGFYAAVVLVGLGAWMLVRGARQRGYNDIVIDPYGKQITIPRTRAGAARDIPFEQVHDTRLVQDSSMSQNRVRAWRVHLVIAGAEKTRPIVDILNRHEAAAFNDWLRARLELEPVARLSPLDVE